MEYVDFHSHILPHMDDGSKNPEMSSKMLEMLEEEEVCVVFATPHYYCYRESEASFLARRADALRALLNGICETDRGFTGPEIRLGAEIRLIREMPESLEIEPLLLEGTNLALFELPFDKYDVCLGENIHNLSVKYQLTPVIAHVDRYVGLFRKIDYEELLSIPNAVYQISTNFMESKKTADFVAGLIRSGLPLLFGSDCHNTTVRPPLMKTAFRSLKKFCSKYKISESEMADLFEYQKGLVQEGPVK